MGHGEDELPAARPRHRAAHATACRTCLGAINIVLASGRIGRAGLRLRDDHRPGQRPGRPRARPEVRPAPRRPRHREPRASRATSPASGASTPEELPRAGRRLLRDLPQGRPRRDQGPAARSASTRWCRCRTATSSRGCSRSWSSSSAIDFFLSETAQLRRRRAARLAARGGRRDRHAASKGGSSRSTRPSTRPGDARQDWRIIQDIAAARWAASTASPSTSPREIFDELRVASQGGVADYSGITYEKIERADTASSGRARRDDHPGHAAAVRAGLVEPGRQGRRAVLLPRRQGPLQRRAVHAAGRGRGRRVSRSS